MKKYRLIKLDDLDNQYCIIDEYNSLDTINTKVIKFIKKNYAEKTFSQYSKMILNFLNWFNQKDYDLLNKDPDQIRAYITYYLSEYYKIRVVDRLNFEVIHINKERHSTIASLISALKLYFNILIGLKIYSYKNPLSTDMKIKREVIDQRKPVMPIQSGIRTPDQNKNIIKNHYIISDKNWEPKIINDKDLANKIFNVVNIKKWHLRDLIIVRLLFETGARISEVCGITIQDWKTTNFKDGASIFNKGSYGIRTKYLSWSSSTTILIQKYFETERYKITNKSLSWYKNSKDSKILDSENIFLSTRGKRYNNQSFRDIYWNPTLRQYFPELNIHKIRHWYVTTNLCFFEEYYPTNQNENLKEGLISYIGWKSGKKMLDVYNKHKNKHMFIEANNQYLERIYQPSNVPSDTQPIKNEENHAFSKLMRLK